MDKVKKMEKMEEIMFLESHPLSEGRHIIELNQEAFIKKFNQLNIIKRKNQKPEN